MAVFATCSLNQWALDFSGNLERTLASFEIAKSKGAIYRLGPELEIPGYGCNDHFLEPDTVLHSWQVLSQLLTSDKTKDIIGDVGMPVVHYGIRYNCRVIFYNSQILLIRPKKYMANDGNYREMRWFTGWTRDKIVEDFCLPEIITSVTGQETCAFGDGVVRVQDFLMGTELCEELFTPASPHIDMSLSGVEVFTNGSASHHEFRKLEQRIDLICEATQKCGGLYLYANQQGCDGERVYYDGSCLIVLNGKILAQGSQFSLQDVEVITASVDLEHVRSYRAGLVSRSLQAATRKPYPEVKASIKIKKSMDLSPPIPLKLYSPSQEIQYGPACWLWDYLRRSKAGGFFLPLSGGVDSCATSLIVFSMCEMVYDNRNDPIVKKDLRQIVRNPDYEPKSPQDICNLIFHTCYMGTVNSSKETRQRAKDLAKQISSYHIDLNIDGIIDSFIGLLQLVTGKTPKFKVFGGTETENLALQNVQARSRMVVAYLFAQLLLWTRSREGSLLVLGSANVDETLRGYLTKYDCSSADLNPIGGISKVDLKEFILHFKNKPGFELLQSFVDAPPTAELEPLTETHTQTDEADMGMTYQELSVFGTLRKVAKLGPFMMFQRLLNDWKDVLNPFQVSDLTLDCKQSQAVLLLLQHQQTQNHCPATIVSHVAILAR
ncbi:hypothetical protein EDD86DRAFT_206169 [Gorgonomyces haynaldii]|nr:hypothetical protein EDD86DRAFT_206169 [Gorgonomyces haynaldii]